MIHLDFYNQIVTTIKYRGGDDFERIISRLDSGGGGTKLGFGRTAGP